MLRSTRKPAQFAPKVFARGKAGYVPPGGKTVMPKRVPRKLRTGDVRPAIYYKFDQRVELSDGSTVTRRTPFPRSEWKYLADQRNNPLWNPSKPNLRALELDAAGRLAKFKQKYSGFEDPSGENESASSLDLDELISTDAEQITTGKLYQEKKPSKKKK